jgi:hypothetical protein
MAMALAACYSEELFNTVENPQMRSVFLVQMLEAMKAGAHPQRLFEDFMRREESNKIWTPN